MRVAIVINSSWNIYNFRLGLIKTLLERGDEVIAIAPKDDYSSKLQELGCTYYPVAMNTTGVNPIRDLVLLFRLIFIYRKVRADIFLHYTIKPSIYGTLAAWVVGSKPVINNVSGLGTVFIQNNWVLHIAVFLYKNSFRFARHVFFQNVQDKDLFQSLVKLKGPSLSVIPGSGIDYQRFSPRFHTNGKFTFIMISRLLVEKGVNEYVQAAEMLRKKGSKARFLLLGHVEKKHLRGVPQELIEKWHESKIIEYVGVSDNVEDWIAKAHVVVLPSYREGLPKTLLEGAAMGRPLIATDVPGCNSVVKHGVNGLLCEAKNAKSLANSMEEMMAFDDPVRVKMGENGRNFVVRHFDETIVISEYLNKIDQFVPASRLKPQIAEAFA